MLPSLSSRGYFHHGLLGELIGVGIALLLGLICFVTGGVFRFFRFGSLDHLQSWLIDERYNLLFVIFYLALVALSSAAVHTGGSLTGIFAPMFFVLPILMLLVAEKEHMWYIAIWMVIVSLLLITSVSPFVQEVKYQDDARLTIDLFMFNEGAMGLLFAVAIAYKEKLSSNISQR